MTQLDPNTWPECDRFFATGESGKQYTVIVSAPQPELRQMTGGDTAILRSEYRAFITTCGLHLNRVSGEDKFIAAETEELIIKI